MPALRPELSASVLLAAACIAANAGAQTAHRLEPSPISPWRAQAANPAVLASEQPGSLTPRPVDAGVEDVGALSRSFRVSLRQTEEPDDFELVYSCTGGGYCRLDGALVASFPQSLYVRDRRGNQRAQIPPGTVLSIGSPTYDAWGPLHAHRRASADGVVDAAVLRTPVARPLALEVSEPLCRPLAAGPIAVPLHAERAARDAQPDPRVNAERERTLDMCNEYYRKHRLRQIAMACEAHAAQTPQCDASARD